LSINPEFVDWICEMSRGVRILTLKKLLLFLFIVKGRMERVDHGEWRNRNLEKRGNLKWNTENYLAERDMIEVQYYANLLGWNIRTIFDYWETLRLLLVHA
jgi:hypothetical protein